MTACTHKLSSAAARGTDCALHCDDKEREGEQVSAYHIRDAVYEIPEETI